MADAHPTVVGAEVRDRHTAEVSADCRADEDLRTAGRVDADLAGFVEQGRLGQLVLLLDFLVCQSADEDGSAVPHNLQHLAGRNLGNVDFEVGVSVVACPSVETADDCDCVETGEVGHGGVVDCAEHVNLRAADVGLLLIVDSVLVEPVVEGHFEVDVVAEVAGPCRGDEEVRLVGH